jgi:hypothetical protein
MHPFGCISTSGIAFEKILMSQLLFTRKQNLVHNTYLDLTLLSKHRWANGTSNFWFRYDRRHRRWQYLSPGSFPLFSAN